MCLQISQRNQAEKQLSRDCDTTDFSYAEGFQQLQAPVSRLHQEIKHVQAFGACQRCLILGEGCVSYKNEHSEENDHHLGWDYPLLTWRGGEK